MKSTNRTSLDKTQGTAEVWLLGDMDTIDLESNDLARAFKNAPGMDLIFMMLKWLAILTKQTKTHERNVILKFQQEKLRSWVCCEHSQRTPSPNPSPMSPKRFS